ncbi:hypothetical protein CCU68_29515 [Pseudomonas gingeri NCPPB 3146 = LMG 5327]|uniref:Uncharacterized protein n=1 Tax=Pseudomonas gingeri NCPPB 3146 = LMG 5327 TaxID=707248 RepID=A0ABX4XVM2_9PSED|nr:hypothetical protein CCU68_29515 [Pseudomonas gingeri NCPPB 3146 = LMG 5327]
MLQKGEGRCSGLAWTSEKSETVNSDLAGTALSVRTRQGSRASSLASQLLQGLCRTQARCATRTPCRSRLAGDGVRMGDARLMGLIAGKPAPTGVVSYASSLCDTDPS